MEVSPTLCLSAFFVCVSWLLGSASFPRQIKPNFVYIIWTLSGAYPGDPTQWLFDLKGRSPKECANRFQRKDAVVALDNYAHAVAKQVLVP